MKIRNSKTFPAFKKSILKFIRLSSNSIFNCHSPKEIKLITRLMLSLSHLREHKLRHNFQDTLNPICSCGDDIETAIHYLLHCPNYLDEGGQSWTTFKVLEKTSMVSELLLFGISSNLEFLQIKMHQIHVFSMLPSNTYWLLKDLTSFLLTYESFE